jgi:MFS family permease
MPNSIGFGKFKIQLSEGFTTIHATVYLLACLLTIALFVFLNSTQGFVIGQILHVPITEFGEKSGNLVFWDEVTALLVVLFVGGLSDIVGRFRVFSLGFLLEAAALYFFTSAAAYFPDLLLWRLLFSIGGACCSCMLSACLADISSEKDRGKFSGILGLVSGFGAVLSVFLLLPLSTKLGGGQVGLQNSYTVVASLAIFASASLAIMSFFTPPQEQPSLNLESSLNLEEQDEGESVSELIVSPEEKPLNVLQKWYMSSRDGVLAVKDSNILLGYLASFLARSDSLSITLYLPLSIYKYYLEEGLCKEIVEGIEKETCNDAYIKASIMSGVTQCFALVGAPIFGYLLDKMNRVYCVFGASFIAASGYILLSFSRSPITPINYLFLFCIGFGEMGLVVASVTLVTSDSIPKHSRGSISGISSFCGAVGILLTSKAGGVLFDWNAGAPFMFLGLVHAFVLLVIGSFFLIRRTELVTSVETSDESSEE